MKTIVDENNYGNTDENYAPALFMTVLFSAPSLIPFQPGITPLCFIMLTIVPFIHTAFISKEFDFFDPIVVISLIYAIGGPVAVLFQNYYEDREIFLLLSNADTALIWTYRGFACFIFGYFFIKMYVRPQKKNIVEIETERDHTLIFIKSLGLIVILGLISYLIIFQGIASTFVESKWTNYQSSLLQTLGIMTNLRYCFFFLYFLLNRSSRDKTLNIIFYIILFIHILFCVGGGSKQYIISLLVCFAFAGSFTKKKTSLKQFFVAAIIFGLIYSAFIVIGNYRFISKKAYTYQHETDIISSIKSQGDLFFQAIERSIESPATFDEYEETTITNNIFSRLSYIAFTTKLFSITRGNPPYEHAIETILVPLFSLLPRDIFNKPDFFHSGLFAKLLGWDFGGYSVTLIGSLYWAWGYIGILIGMFIIGIIFANIAVKSRYPLLYGVRNKILFILLSLALIEPGMTFQNIITDLIRIWCFVLVLSFLITHSNIFTAPKNQRGLQYLERIK